MRLYSPYGLLGDRAKHNLWFFFRSLNNFPKAADFLKNLKRFASNFNFLKFVGLINFDTDFVDWSCRLTGQLTNRAESYIQ